MNKEKLAGLIIVLLLVGNGYAAKPERSAGEEQLPGWPTNAFQNIEYGILLEIEGFGSKIGGENESDIVVATVAADVEMAATEWMLGHIGLLWEQDSREDDNVDEAYIALGASENIPYYLVAGRFYQPVGNFETAFISDPLTLELMEMNRTAGMVGYGNAWLDVNVGAFNGDTKKGVPAGGGGDSTISDFYASAMLMPVEQLKLGVYWLSDLMETYNYGQVGDLVSNEPGYEKIGGAGVFANAYMGPVMLNVEFASAVDEYNLAGGQYHPMAFNVEGSMLLREKVTLGVKYEASKDLYAGYDNTVLAFTDKLPGQAYGAVVSYGFHEYAAVGIEYLHFEELDNDARGDLFTVQFSLEI